MHTALPETRLFRLLEVFRRQLRRLHISLFEDRHTQDFYPPLVGMDPNGLALNPQFSPQLLRESDAPLVIHFALRAHVCRVERQLPCYSRIVAIFLKELFVFAPHSHRVNLSYATVERGYEQLFLG